MLVPGQELASEGEQCTCVHVYLSIPRCAGGYLGIYLFGRIREFRHPDNTLVASHALQHRRSYSG